MAIGVVDDDSFFAEVKKGIVHQPIHKNEINIVKPTELPAEVIEISKGKKQGDVNVPDSLRAIIGETSQIEGRQSALELAKSFGISPASVSAYSNSATSCATYDEPKKSLRDHLNRTKERISKKAQSRLIASLNSITPEKLKEVKVTEAALVAKSMSGIIKDMEPEKEAPTAMDGPKFIFYSPSFKKEDHFDTIILNNE